MLQLDLGREKSKKNNEGRLLAKSYFTRKSFLSLLRGKICYGRCFSVAKSATKMEFATLCKYLPNTGGNLTSIQKSSSSSGSSLIQLA